jgi:uncharacterized protein with FMN-binding domain
VRRVIVVVLGTAAGTTLLVGLKAQAGTPPAHPSAARRPAPASAGPRPSAAVVVPPPGPGTAAPPSAADPPSAAESPAADGQTYDGRTISTPYGPVAVSITVKNGRITDVDALLPAYGHSGELTDKAGPRLRQQTLARQSAKVDTVSGATYTSEAYRQSLQSALDQVKR